MVIITYYGQRYDVTVLGRYDPQRTYVLYPISENQTPEPPPKTKEWIEAKRKKQEEIIRKTKEWEATLPKATLPK